MLLNSLRLDDRPDVLGQIEDVLLGACLVAERQSVDDLVSGDRSQVVNHHGGVGLMTLAHLLHPILHILECDLGFIRVDDTLPDSEVVCVLDELACAFGAVGPDHLLGNNDLTVRILEATLHPAHDGDGGILLDRIILATFDGLDDPLVDALLAPDLSEKAG